MVLWRSSVLTLIKGNRGVTGLETAIILIAFVVVASVFAFTILSTGIFSAERSKETVYAGLEQARGSVELKGSVIGNGVVDIQLSDANTVWTDLTNATATIDTTDKKEDCRLQPCHTPVAPDKDQGICRGPDGSQNT